MFLTIWLNRFKLKEIFLVCILLMVLMGNAIDLLEDMSQQDKISFFFVVQILTIFLSIGGLYLLIKLLILSYQQELYTNRLNDKTKKIEIRLEQSLLRLKRISKEYNKQLMAQFDLWGLTQSEQEIALLLLKGLSFKEIANIRNRQEKTVRQQASAIYRKSGVTGRHEFSAWFFEDMLG